MYQAANTLLNLFAATTTKKHVHHQYACSRLRDMQACLCNVQREREIEKLHHHVVRIYDLVDDIYPPLVINLAKQHYHKRVWFFVGQLAENIVRKGLNAQCTKFYQKNFRYLE